jgi:fructose-1,6-bisphosphatase/inositol monophosphatase family enzyme
MTNSDNFKLKEFILSTFREAFDFINPYFSNYSNFSESLASRIKEKETNNIQYNFDLKTDEIFRRNIEKFSISGKIYSEESGWYEWGDLKYEVVIDPFCGSTLASKTFLEAAAGISVFSSDYKFLASGILDYQMGIAAITNEKETKFFQIQTGKEIEFNLAQKNGLGAARITISLETKERRKKEYIEKVKKIFSDAGMVMIGSGHYFWLKLAMGFVDGYLDISKGQKLYEMFAATVAQKNGCVVTDLAGEEFSAEKYLEIFEKEPNFRLKLVAARNKALHKEILESMK